MLPSRIFFDTMLDDFNDDSKLGALKMKADIYEKDGIYHVETDMPGFNKEDIKIEFNKGNLILRAEHKEHVEEKENKKYLRRERTTYGKCERSFYLGEVDEDNIEAKFNNGILKITVPKRLEEQNKKIIEIK